MTAVEPSGELNVGLCYNDHTQRLIVSVVEARSLKAASLDNSSPGGATDIPYHPTLYYTIIRPVVESKARLHQGNICQHVSCNGNKIVASLLLVCCWIQREGIQVARDINE